MLCGGICKGEELQLLCTCANPTLKRMVQTEPMLGFGGRGCRSPREGKELTLTTFAKHKLEVLLKERANAVELEEKRDRERKLLDHCKGMSWLQVMSQHCR